MLRDEIEWKVDMKCPPVYVGPCHDPVVKKGIFKGVGHRIRMNSSKQEYFDETVEECPKSFSIAGYNFQHAKTELRKFRDIDPVEMIKKGPNEKDTKNNSGSKVFYVDNFDPRMPHLRQLISRNYHHIEKHPLLSKIFPRGNLVGSCRRLPNLGEILSPTIQKNHEGGDPYSGGHQGRNSGSFYCAKFRQGKSCDTCLYLKRETSFEESVHYGKKFAVHGHLVHLQPTQRPKLRWFVYLLEDLGCKLQYVGSTTDVCSRWAATKSACNKANSNSTGMYKHFMDGCPSDAGSDKLQLRLTLLDYLDTTEQKLTDAGHKSGPQCQCQECDKLLRTENKWILRLGTFFGDSGLNSRDEIKSKVRGNYRK